MSHQSGIKASDKLKQVFSLAHEGNIRLLRIVVKGEELVPDRQIPPSGNWRDDYLSIVEREIHSADQSNEAAYFFFRLDSRNNVGYEWLFIAFVPDLAPARQKMLNASSRTTLRLEFGAGYIKHDLFGSSFEEVCLDTFMERATGSGAPAPLTQQEQELRELDRQGVGAEINVATKHELIHAVSFPLTEDARLAIERFKQYALTRVNYVQLALDLDKEQIHLVKSESIAPEDLPAQVPTTNARFHLFLFDHSHEGQQLRSIFFIYSMPSEVSSIKEKMLYSSCKGALVAQLADEFQLQIDKKMEVEEGHELAPAQLAHELHPPPADTGVGTSSSGSTMRFQKPAAPGRRKP